MSDPSSNNALILDARDRLRKRQRLTEAHVTALQASLDVPDDAKAKMLSAHLALTIAAAKSGKRISSWDRNYLTVHAPEAVPAGPIAKSVLMARMRAKDRAIERRQCADPTRRARLEKHPIEWLRYYLASAYPLPWGQVHRDIVKAAVRAIRTGSGMAVAAPRGTGKSTVLWGVALWALLSGQCRFPVVAGWSHAAARRMLRKWLSTLGDNKRLADDYPEVCQPFEASVQSTKLSNLTWGGGESCGADVRQMDGLIVLPSGLGALSAISIRGNTRGLYVSLADGSTLRPDVLLLDDPQDKVTASSQDLSRKTIERIEGDLFSLSGPATRLAVMAAVTIIAEKDVASHYLSHPDFEAIRVSQITSWPTGWAKRSSDSRKLWNKWNDARVDGLAEGDGGKAAREFYRANKAELTKGMSVSWAARYDRKRRDPDALFAAMWDYYRLGERAFLAERQNAPLTEEMGGYNMTPELICSRIAIGRHRGELPAEARILIASTDINGYGLHSTCLSFANDQTGSVVAYGRYDKEGVGIVSKDCNEAESKRRIYEALVEVGRQLSAMQFSHHNRSVHPGLWIIDAGWHGDVVRRYADGAGRTCGLQIVLTHGYGWRQYRPTGRNVIGRPGERWHRSESPVLGRFTAYQADYWREISQRAWLGSVGAPGSLSLFEGGTHKEFAEQLCRERLIEKKVGALGTEWLWQTAPGWHDYGDCLVLCYVGASIAGIGSSGGIAAAELEAVATAAANGNQVRPTAKQVAKPRRKCRIPIGEGL